MRFAEKGYYIEQYVKCANCGILIYGPALGSSPALFCSEWCRDWPERRDIWTEERPPDFTAGQG